MESWPKEKLARVVLFGSLTIGLLLRALFQHNRDHVGSLLGTEIGLIRLLCEVFPDLNVHRHNLSKGAPTWNRTTISRVRAGGNCRYTMKAKRREQDSNLWECYLRVFSKHRP